MKGTSLFTLITGFTLSLGSSPQKQNWYNYKTTWTVPPQNGFFDQPRTENKAIENGWKFVSNDCSSNANFPGNRYASPEDSSTPGIIFIYDVNGFIAGTHSVIPQSKTYQDEYFPWAQSPWYRSDNVLGQDVLLTTAFFVDPEIICDGGRSQAEFEVQGTGSRLLFQNGPKISDHVRAPLKQTDADSEVWSYDFLPIVPKIIFIFEGFLVQT